MMARLAAVLVAIALPVEASACRLHAIWHYPWPQRCGVVHAVRRSLAEPKDWYVEIVLTPQVLDEISHGVGIEKIKQLHAGERP
jgi:hypothetical protein